MEIVNWQEGYHEVVHVLLKRKDVLVNQAPSNGFTSLHAAAKEGYDKVVELLLHQCSTEGAANTIEVYRT